MLSLVRLDQILDEVEKLALGQGTVQVEREKTGEEFHIVAILEHLRNFVEEEAHVDFGVFLKAQRDRLGLDSCRLSDLGSLLHSSALLIRLSE